MLAAPDVVEVIPGLLIGSAPRSRQRRALSAAGVTQVIDLRAESPHDYSEWPAQVTVLCAPIERAVAPEVACLAELSGVITDILAAGGRVLVHCHDGGGRAGMVACAVLMRRGCSLAEADSIVRTHRRRATPIRTQIEALRALERRLRGSGAAAAR